MLSKKSKDWLLKNGREKCSWCRGSGKVLPDHGDPCMICNGSGIVIPSLWNRVDPSDPIEDFKRAKKQIEEYKAEPPKFYVNQEVFDVINEKQKLDGKTFGI